MLGLAEEHAWKGGGGMALNGVFCNANIPTEEVFTAPHKDMVDGIVRSSKPLSYQGSLIDGIRVRFERGRIVEMSAEKGEDAFRNLISTDEGAARLGEVALVPHSSPISKSGIIFNNTLFDENAASHIAVGQSYTENIRDGSKRVQGGTHRTRRQHEPRSRGLDDRLGRTRRRRHSRQRHGGTADAQGRVGDLTSA